MARVFAVLALGTLWFAPSAGAAVLTATPPTLGSVFAAARGGDVIELTSGDYGRFTGGAKPATVTIRPQAGAAATIALAFDGASGIRVEGVTIPDLLIQGTSHDIAVAGSTFTGMAVINASQMANANVVLDGNRHPGINVCSNCYEGRIQVAGSGSQPSGVTISNSVLGPGGDADGIQIGANGVQVLGNEFVGIRQVGTVHTDSLQLYGQRNTVVRGNYFHDFDVGIMAPDGGSNEQITDNVFVGGGNYRPAIQLGSQQSSVFAHNTTKDIDVFMDAKDGAAPSTRAVVRDNVVIAGTINAPAAKCSGCTVAYNLFSRGATGSNAITATPVLAGGANPSSYAGFVLAPGSPGKGSASDGTDRGIRLAAAQTPPPPGSPGAPASGSAGGGTAATAAAKLRVHRRISRAALRHGLRVKVTATRRVKLGFRLVRYGGKRALARANRTLAGGTRSYRLRARPLPRAGRLVLTVNVTDAAGARTRLRAVIRVVR